MSTVQSYRDLIVWQKAMALAEAVYRCSAQLPREETYGLRSQLTRAAVSLPANIAEGQSRHGRAEFLHFRGVARGSLGELETLTMLCRRLGYLSERDAASLLEDCQEIGRLLAGLVRSLKYQPPVSL